MPQGPWHLITHVLEIGKEYAFVGMAVGVVLALTLSSDPVQRVGGAVVAGFCGAVIGALVRAAVGPKD